MTEGLAGLIAAGTGPSRMRRDLGRDVAPFVAALANANKILAIAAGLPPGLEKTALMELYSISLRAALAMAPAAAAPKAAVRKREPTSEPAKPAERPPDSFLGQFLHGIKDVTDFAADRAADLAAGRPLAALQKVGAPTAIGGLFGPGGFGALGPLLADLEQSRGKPRKAAPAPSAPAQAVTSGIGLLLGRLASVMAQTAVSGGSPVAGAAARGQEMIAANQAAERAIQAPAAAALAPSPPTSVWPAAAGPLGARRKGLDSWPRTSGAGSPEMEIRDPPGPAGGGPLAPLRPAAAALPGPDLSERIADILREQASRQGIDLT